MNRAEDLLLPRLGPHARADLDAGLSTNAARGTYTIVLYMSRIFRLIKIAQCI